MPKRELLTGTAEANLNEALKQEAILHNCGPGDPYYRIAKANIEFYLDAAAALERGERETTNLYADRFEQGAAK